MFTNKFKFKSDVTEICFAVKIMMMPIMMKMMMIMMMMMMMMRQPETKCLLASYDSCEY